MLHVHFVIALSAQVVMTQLGSCVAADLLISSLYGYGLCFDPSIYIPCVQHCLPLLRFFQLSIATFVRNSLQCNNI